ncbi:MAG: transcription antitermination factor NusB [Firmicutes bacterium]|nr:transcription antitermination factor NusB [Bacillota bacterium]
MKRKAAREHAFRILFAARFTPAGSFDIDQAIERYFTVTIGEDTVPGQSDIDFIRAEVLGTLEHQELINGYIEGALVDWKLSRLSYVDLAILQMAFYEMKYAEDMPVSVSINEAVELAKKYSSDEAPAFINGVLGTLARQLEEEGK